MGESTPLAHRVKRGPGGLSETNRPRWVAGKPDRVLYRKAVPDAPRFDVITQTGFNVGGRDCAAAAERLHHGPMVSPNTPPHLHRLAPVGGLPNCQPWVQYDAIFRRAACPPVKGHRRVCDETGDACDSLAFCHEIVYKRGSRPVALQRVLQTAGWPFPDHPPRLRSLAGSFTTLGTFRTHSRTTVALHNTCGAHFGCACSLHTRLDERWQVHSECASR